ncbi:hypothetical protein D9613_008942 [Agrocybe pediades]|uniref:Uncharacterized protein n=1 Tax=Agrocybe pediades TaxID=84607 RepID=A0A8H4QST8_9AGAR|nr:hypothetical protein D9613_008942 [Agrocybe pediades]
MTVSISYSSSGVAIGREPQLLNGLDLPGTTVHSTNENGPGATAQTIRSLGRPVLLVAAPPPPPGPPPPLGTPPPPPPGPPPPQPTRTSSNRPSHSTAILESSSTNVSPDALSVKPQSLAALTSSHSSSTSLELSSTGSSSRTSSSLTISSMQKSPTGAAHESITTSTLVEVSTVVSSVDASHPTQASSAAEDSAHLSKHVHSLGVVVGRCRRRRLAATQLSDPTCQYDSGRETVPARRTASTVTPFILEAPRRPLSTHINGQLQAFQSPDSVLSLSHPKNVSASADGTLSYQESTVQVYLNEKDGHLMRDETLPNLHLSEGTDDSSSCTGPNGNSTFNMLDASTVEREGVRHIESTTLIMNTYDHRYTHAVPPYSSSHAVRLPSPLLHSSGSGMPDEQFGFPSPPPPLLGHQDADDTPPSYQSSQSYRVIHVQTVSVTATRPAFGSSG